MQIFEKSAHCAFFVLFCFGFFLSKTLKKIVAMSYMAERTPSVQWQIPVDPHRSSSLVYQGRKTTDSDVYRVGIYGWRKRCLYIMIILLTIVIIVNMAITAWIMKVLQFTTSGMGSMKIIDDGIRVTGRSEFDKPVHFRKLSTAKNVPLSIESDRGISMTARNRSRRVTGRLELDEKGHLRAVCDRFEIRNTNNDLLFFSDKNEVAVRVENLRIIGDGGSVFEGAVQTEVIRPEPNSPLRLESPTRGLHVDAAQDIELLSRAGDIQATSLLDMTMESTDGELRMNSPNIFISGLRQGNEEGHSQYQLCLCENGRIFLARNGADCRADTNICN